ncbi:MAG: DUF481 domain-containing protein [Bacteroidia bacterium]
MPLLNSAQIVNIEGSRLDETQQGWQGLLDVKFFLVQNKNTLYQFSNKITLQYVDQKHRWLFLNDINLSLSDELKFEQNAFQHLRYGYMLDSALTFETFAQNQYDRIQLIKQRVLLGTGFRFSFLQKGLLNSFYGLTYMLEYEQELKTEEVHLNSRLSTYINFKLTIKDWLKYFNTTYYQPRLTDFSDFRFTTNNTLQFKVNGNLSVITQFTMTYDSNPVEDPSVLNMNMRLTNGFSYKFN